MTAPLHVFQAKLSFWQYCQAMVFASKNSPLWRQEHESNWTSFRSIVICVALILSSLGLIIPFIGFVAGSVVFLSDLLRAVLNHNMGGIVKAMASCGIYTAAMLAWIIWFKMALSWFEMQRLGAVLPIIGTVFACIPLIHYEGLAIFALPSIILACFLCVWHMVREKHTAHSV